MAQGQQGTTSEDYSAQYYAHHCGSDEAYSWESPGWRAFFRSVARNLQRVMGSPETVLDVGASNGMLVQAFAELGIDARGFDLSESAVASADESVRDRLWVGSATEPIEGTYDLITCIEVLEHLSPLDAETAIDNMCAASDRLVITSTPADFREPTHINVHPTADWVAAFASRGFFRRTDLDVSFLTPWAFCVERADLTPRDIVHRYESLTTPMRTELLDMRAELLAAHRTLSQVDEDELQRLRHEILRLRDHAKGHEAEAHSARADRDAAVSALQRELSEIRSELDAVKSSQRWRVGGLIAAPVAAVRRSARK